MLQYRKDNHTDLFRIRFGKDIDVLDLELYIHLDGWLDAAFQVVATVILICIEIPFFVVFVVPICSIYSLTQVEKHAYVLSFWANH